MIHWLASTVRVLQKRIVALESEFRTQRVQISLAAALDIPVLAPRFRQKPGRPCGPKIIVLPCVRFADYSGDEEDDLVDNTVQTASTDVVGSLLQCLDVAESNDGVASVFEFITNTRFTVGGWDLRCPCRSKPTFISRYCSG